ncbi:Firmicu-CTERM sorting domain-containing protein [Eubacterium xylanophilum]|uniref:Firmicu-CTERM sorting domain-containing protein n=1 Tax=Eubacterium xylanophilum TaxID=39497 RepID=UPI000479C7EA|nr:Firmicu-CTERM sorting domain-containing protein [Eubacterium xylanophilum]
MRRKLWNTLILAVFMMAVIGFISTEKVEAASGINIDGYYDDWESYPETQITYMSNNAECNHKAHIYCDDDYLYVHVHASDLYTSQMPFQRFNLDVNGQRKALLIQADNGHGQIDYGQTYGQYPVGVNTAFLIYLDYQGHLCDGSAALTVHDKNYGNPNTLGDDIEFKVSIKDICEIFNVEADSINSIRVSNDNLGPEGLTIAGTSSGPVIGVVIAIIIATIASLAYTRRKKEKVQ